MKKTILALALIVVIGIGAELFHFLGSGPSAEPTLPVNRGGHVTGSTIDITFPAEWTVAIEGATPTDYFTIRAYNNADPDQADGAFMLSQRREEFDLKEKSGVTPNGDRYVEKMNSAKVTEETGVANNFGWMLEHEGHHFVVIGLDMNSTPQYGDLFRQWFLAATYK